MNDRIVQEAGGGVVLRVHVQPNAARTECVGIHGQALKFRVAAPPVDGAANAALVRFVADALGLPPSAVRVDSGQGSRRKRLTISRVTAERVRALLLEPPRNGH